MNMILNNKAVAVVAALSIWVSPALYSQTDTDARIERLEAMMLQMQQELATLKAERDSARERATASEAKLAEIASTQEAVLAELEERPAAGVAASSGPSLPPGLQLGAYGEHHFNFTDGPNGDQSDIHRFVVFFGYEFADWISLVSETELEHAFVEGGHGELVLEQFYVDFRLSTAANVRIGRALHPAGIINRLHEPTTFFGVERPTYSANLLPSTYSIDGIGLWGSLADWFSYEVYLHGGLDGSKIGVGNGFRGGRLNERPGLEDYGISSRIDIQPLVALGADTNVNWRVGVSYSDIGVQNANKGANGAQTAQGDVKVWALDTDLNIGKFDIRAEWASVTFSDPATLGTPTAPATLPLAGMPKSLTGWYAQVAYHLLPESMKQGKLEHADFVPFIRYSDLDLDDAANSKYDLEEFTFGFSFYPVEQVVLKADYTFVEDDANTSNNNRYDFGLGYSF